MFKILNDNSDVAGVIASKTVDYNNYLNGTSSANEVQVTTTITAYDADANDVGVQGGDKVYLRLYIYNNSVSSSTLIVKSNFDQDWWPTGGRYDTTTTAAATSDTKRDLLIIGALGVGILVLFLWLGKGYLWAPKRRYY